MEVFIFIGLVVLLIVLISFKNSMERRFINLSQTIDFLRNQLELLNKQADSLSKPEVSEPVSQQEKHEKSSELSQEQEVITPIFEPIPEPVVEETISYKAAEPPPTEFDIHKENASGHYKAEPTIKKPGFFERNPDLEKFIGENLINKIGIAILVLGIGFFVKYAIDKEWINEIGRVFIGLLCGGALLGVAHKTRKDFKAFSSVLVGGGMAVFYFTITIAFHEYNLFSQAVAFIIMIVITAFTVLLAVVYDRKELAILAIIGGFLSPFLVSTGEGNYIILFSYILILNLGMMILAYYKHWNIVNLVCYLFTLLLYGSWLGKELTGNESIPVAGGLAFATLFYLIFFIMNIINNIRENRKFLAFNLTILISNTFLYYTAGILLLEEINEGHYQGLFTALIAIFNFGFAYFLFKNKKVDMNLVYLLIGLVLTFLSLTAPVQLEGNYITLFWASEAVLLLWLSQKSGIKLIKISSVIVIGLMIISLLMDWQNLYMLEDHLPIIINKVFITTLVALVSIFATISLLKKEEEILFTGVVTLYYKYILQSILVILLYFGLLLEIRHQIQYYVEPFALREVFVGIYNFLFIIGCFIYTQRRQVRSLKELVTILGVFGVVMFLLHYHSEIKTLRYAFLETNETSIFDFSSHYLLVILVLCVIFLSIKNIIALFTLYSKVGKGLIWFFSFAVVFIFSAELDHIVSINGWDPEIYDYYALSQNHKIGFPILWGICSFVFMILGMKYKIKSLRIISLSLFFITLLKLFIFDISGISEGGKIAAFICLGLLLLIVSFMYQKLKNIILEGEVKSSEA